jgi:hypothetical protein
MGGFDLESILEKILADVSMVDAISGQRRLLPPSPFTSMSKSSAETLFPKLLKESTLLHNSQKTSPDYTVVTLMHYSDRLVVTPKEGESLLILPNGGELVLHLLGDMVIG